MAVQRPCQAQTLTEPLLWRRSVDLLGFSLREVWQIQISHKGAKKHGKQ
jgi:hypothetical protein